MITQEISAALDHVKGHLEMLEKRLVEHELATAGDLYCELEVVREGVRTLDRVCRDEARRELAELDKRAKHIRSLLAEDAVAAGEFPT